MLMLVDSAGLWYRSFFGLPSSMRSPDGTQINAVRGFIDGLATLIRTREPSHLVCALDDNWRPTWRVELLPTYKAHRVATDGVAEEEPDQITHQVPIILDLLSAIGIAHVGATDFEADDVMATLAARSTDAVEVVTGDRDLFQVVSDAGRVRVVYIARGISKAEVYDDAAVLARFGVPAKHYADFAVLRGDASDGLPGVKGVGEKTAARLVNDFDGIDGVIAAAADPDAALPPRVRGALTASAGYLAVAPRVVTTHTDAPVPTVDGVLPSEPADADALAALTERWGLTNPITRLRSALGWS
ncbi:5'-3' exonuclease [Stackebrandtia soli]|uniref:5'-3' exonuclease n=1 Tax=Stackebrandtia soli TaxID=1892856 RepID=UPI0039E9A1A9